MEQGHLLVSMMRKHSMMIILDCEQGPQIDVMMMSSTNPPGARGTPWRVDSIETLGRMCDTVTKRGLACDESMAV